MKTGRRWIYVSLLGALALLNYLSGNMLYALLIVGAFLGLTFVTRRLFLYAAVPAILAVLISTTALTTAGALIRSNLNTARNFDSQVNTILAWDSGREVLPLEVQQMLFLLRANQLHTYRVSDPIWKDFEQRLVEGLWPARLDPASRNLFRLNTDPDDPSCRLVRQLENVVLERCR